MRFIRSLDSCDLELRWNRLQREAGLPDSFVLLPATSAIGSYKNPELVLRLSLTEIFSRCQ